MLGNIKLEKVINTLAYCVQTLLVKKKSLKKTVPELGEAMRTGAGEQPRPARFAETLGKKSGRLIWHTQLFCIMTVDLFFMQLAFNLSNRVTDTLESSKILIYSEKHVSLNTQSLGKMPKPLND